ncbi:MAG: acetate/propionate family kinase [Candidatus Vogelbacteria bacterium]|nr:acetate/propionate family kinase [Candidatus Vogelbacteria bacterium]
MAYIILSNPGSESRKYALYKDSEQILSLHLEKNKGSYISTVEKGTKVYEENVTEEQFRKCAEYLIKTIKKECEFDPTMLAAIGVRIVAPGHFFATHRKIDETFMTNLNEKLAISPLHIEASLGEIKMFKETLPDVPIYALSDSAFHRERPLVSRLYAIPRQMRENLEAERFGYHGLSAEYIVSELDRLCRKLPSKLIICHIGGGISVMSFKDGKTVDTSMGFSPLEGVMMATRSGDIDPILVSTLIEKTDSPISLVETLLNRGCGLLGLSGISEDPRDLLKAEKEGNKNAKSALELYVYRIKKMIGSMATTLDGIDALVFTGTVGERSANLRNRICLNMNSFGIRLDDAKNSTRTSGSGEIGDEGSEVQIFAMKTNEMKVMAQELLNLL